MRRAATAGLVLTLVLATAASGQSGGQDALTVWITVLAASISGLALVGLIVIGRWKRPSR